MGVFETGAKKLFKLIFVAVLISASNQIYSQSKIQIFVDSLEVTISDLDKVQLYKDISVNYFLIDLDSSIYYGLLGLDLAEQIEYQEGVVSLSNNLGIFYQKKGLYEISIIYYFKSLELKEMLKDERGIASTQNNLGSVYNEMEQPEEALKYFNECLPYYKKVEDSINLATITMNIGNAFLLMQENEKAYRHYMIAVPIFESINDSSKLGKLKLNIGQSFENKELWDSAKQYYNQALEIGLLTHNNAAYSRANLYMGRLLVKDGDNPEKAIIYLLQSYNLGLKIGALKTLSDASELLVDAYEMVHAMDSSLFYSKEFNRYRDSLSFAELNRSLGILETKLGYEIDLRESELKLSKQKLWRNFMFLVSGLALLLTIYIYRSYRNKQKANKLLAEMDELKSRLFSNISHEFRTPLTLILGPLEQMLSKEATKNPSKKTVKLMQRNANRLLDLVNQMLDLSKVDAGSMKLDLAERDILKFSRILLSSFSSLAEQKEIKFEQKIPEGSLKTWFDGDKIEKIVTNLLSNAFKFTPEGGVVRCEVIMPESKEGIQIIVEDTGKGISGEQLDKIFDRFHQVEKPGDPERIGTGIGLALIKELVELLHGDISVESTVGTGTTFVLNLPLGKDHLKESEYTLVADVPGVESEKSGIDVDSHDQPAGDTLYDDTGSDKDFPMVLTVEDHADIRSHILENLEDCCRMIEASDGEMGLNKAIECIPDLVITDLMMPKMDGVEMCKKLKTDERTSHIPVIMLTAKASVEDRIEGIETGADAYMTKPFNIKELRTRVNKLIEQRKNLRERFSKEIKLEPRDIAITSADERFLNRALEVIEKQMGNPDFEVRDFQSEIGMSRMQLFRKLKALTNSTPSEFIRLIRLKRAAKLMEQNYGNVAQITYEVGFNNLSYFAKCFKEFFGQSPSDYMKEHSS